MIFRDRVCFMCGEWRAGVEAHHIFGAANRNKSDVDELVVWLCPECHRTGRHAVHQSAVSAKLLHAFGEMMWLRRHPDMGVFDFRRRYGKNYLEDYRE